MDKVGLERGSRMGRGGEHEVGGGLSWGRVRGG